ncbi:hypothetical protein GGR53DRAFT_480535, partial [Hypoxylon sp. FL1150]
MSPMPAHLSFCQNIVLPHLSPPRPRNSMYQASIATRSFSHSPFMSAKFQKLLIIPTYSPSDPLSILVLFHCPSEGLSDAQPASILVPTYHFSRLNRFSQYIFVSYSSLFINPGSQIGEDQFPRVAKKSLRAIMAPKTQSESFAHVFPSQTRGAWPEKASRALVSWPPTFVQFPSTFYESFVQRRRSKPYRLRSPTHRYLGMALPESERRKSMIVAADLIYLPHSYLVWSL